MSYTLDTVFSTTPGTTDLRAQLVDTTGSSVGSAISTGFAELGGSSGFFLWYYAAFPDGYCGAVYFYSASAPATILWARAVNPPLDPLAVAVPGNYPEGTLGEIIGHQLDAAVSSRADGAQYTETRAVQLDRLDAAISSRISGTDLTPERAAKIDNLDVAVSTRAAAGQVTPNTSVPARHSTSSFEDFKEEMVRGDTFKFRFAVTLSGLIQNVSDWERFWFAAKRYYTDPDARAIVFVDDGTDQGVARFNASSGICEVTINPSQTISLENQRYYLFGVVRGKDSNGGVHTIAQGILVIQPSLIEAEI